MHPLARFAPPLLTALSLVVVAGCGARHTDTTAANSSSDASAVSGSTNASGNGATTTMVTADENGRQRQAMRTAVASRGQAPEVHRITITNRRCIRFEPQWTNVRIGQPVVWHSELKTPLTIYVSPGVFDRLSFTIHPGQTVSTGPARAAGRYSFWTEPCACREAPRGPLLAGPGIRVRDNFFASAPGIPRVH